MFGVSSAKIENSYQFETKTDLTIDRYVCGELVNEKRIMMVLWRMETLLTSISKN